MVKRATAIAGATFLAAVSVFWTAVAFLIDGFRCEDGCAGPGAGTWREDGGAWQWNAQFCLALAGMVCALSCLVYVVRGHRTKAIVSLAAGAVLSGASLAFLGMG